MSVAPPTIEMLWESVDPQIALQRFGFADAESTAQWVAEVVAAEWGTSVVSCERIVLSAGNALAWVTASDQRQLIAKWSVHPQLFARLAHVSRLTSWLDAQGFPVSAPISPLHGGPRAEVLGVSMELQAVVPGSLLDVRDPGQVRAAGAAHAALHGLLADYPAADGVERGSADFVERTGGQRAREPLVDRIAHWLQSEAHRYPEILTRALSTLSPRHQPSFLRRSSCTMTSEPPICCAEDAAWSRYSTSKRLLSIMRLSTSRRAAVLLGTRFRDWKPIPPETRDTYLAGYGSVRPLSRAEASWMRTLILWSTLQIMHGWNPDEWLMSAMDEANRVLD